MRPTENIPAIPKAVTVAVRIFFADPVAVGALGAL
jgi:hypothetical protein